MVGQVAEAAKDWEAAKELHEEVLLLKAEAGGHPPAQGYPRDPSPEAVMQKLARVAVQAGQLEEAEDWCRCVGGAVGEGGVGGGRSGGASAC